MDRVAQDMGFTVEYIDIDANTDAAIRANVMSVPTWHISVNGVGKAAYTGAYPEHKLREIVSRYV